MSKYAVTEINFSSIESYLSQIVCPHLNNNNNNKSLLTLMQQF